MTTVEIKHFGLKAGPFTKEIDDTELWLPTSKKGVVEEIVEVAQARESMGIFGDPGVG